MQKFLAIFAFFNFALIICCACPAGSFMGVRPQDCFMYRNILNSNLDAENDCQSLGGHLASIHDSTTNKIIGAQLKKMGIIFAEKSVWLGGYKPGDYDWMWYDSTPFDYQAFAPGQNGTYDSDKLSVFNISDNAWHSVDLYGGEILFPYLCTVPSFTTPKPTHSPCPSGSFPGINLYDCFVFQNASLNWNDSVLACNRILGQLGRLAFIQDSFTNNLIRNKLATLTNNMVQTVRIGGEVVYYCDNTWHGNGCNYIWSWLDGTNFYYENFPNITTAENPLPGKKAAFRIDNGFWNPTNADEKHPFLCQVPPV